MRLLGLPIESPQTIITRAVSDLGAIARLARAAPAKLDRMLELGEEIAGIGHQLLAIAERLDRRAEAIMVLGERLDVRAVELIDLGEDMRDLGERVDSRGAEIVDGATRVADTGGELIGVLPALERALEMATPLEGAIDRFGRLVDRLPGGQRRRPAVGPGSGGTSTTERRSTPAEAPRPGPGAGPGPRPGPGPEIVDPSGNTSDQVPRRARG